ncbi:MAG: ankyrin repeat domain-containing protein [Gammaproteobacteria bacterium]|nr:ankyrin repeat domain-containing protein [Gammaproteobacteria bacterium]MBU1601696.1 ankyrin repeat domain-containing protein [Gammaproteobacteria bacterium]MBU2434775.1 ankyrin repeat domain-containing protein [Gammaproteobacteria bacterium]MBU2448016.1 ankyrin repeat domain-containing protein [Gammaproteobacteria bacterium]
MTKKGFKTSNLIEAIRAGRLQGVITALDNGEDIELPDMHGYSGLPLRTACFEGNLAIVGELLKHGANPNAMASDGPGAPLRLALRRGHQDIVDRLLHEGAILPEGVAITNQALDISFDSLPEEAEPSPPESWADNVIEFTPSGLPAADPPVPTDDADSPNEFGTATSLLSMDLLFLEENEINTGQTKPTDKQP